MDKFFNMIKMQAQMASSGRTFSALGIVTGYDPANYLVTVELYGATDDSPALQTGSIPLFSPWPGNGWGMFCPPNLGDIIEVHFQEGSIQNAYACLRSFGNNNLPLSVPSGEFWLVHQTGSSVKLTNDGKVLINGNVEIDITAPIVNINVTSLANITAQTVKISSSSISMGDLTEALTGLMNNIAIGVYNEHTHNLLVDITDVPNQPLDGSALTTNVQAN
jgi:hypothetical protein